VLPPREVWLWAESRRFDIVGLAWLSKPAITSSEGDISLYREIAARVESGDSYYESAADLHRQNQYPLKPFVTVRSPALAYITALLGPTGLLITAWGLLLLALGSWHRTLKERPLAERAVVLSLIAAGGGAIISPNNLFVHELWAGLLITLALGLAWSSRLQLLAAACAVVLRELAAPILILLLYPFSRKQALGVSIVCVIVVSYYGLHMANVSAVLRPDDLPSQGWFGLRGLDGLRDDFSKMVGVDVPLWIALLPLVGWGFHRDPRPFLWCAGVIFAICVLAREDNLFWALMLFPVYCAGPAFLLTNALGWLKKIATSRSEVGRT
jgi:hypothetical protein